jgi:hypothetical protein
VPAINEGSKWLQKRYAQTAEFRRMARKAWTNAGSPERRAMNSKTHQGKTHSESTRRKVAAVNRRRIWTTAMRRMLSDKAKRQWTQPPFADRRWSSEEIDFVKRLPCKEAAERTGRTVKAVQNKRQRLRLSTAQSQRAK